MRTPKWAIPLLLRLLSLSGLTSAAGDKASMMVGFALSNAAAASSPATPSTLLGSQPALSLELDFVVKFADRQLSFPIMPLHLLGKKSWNVYNHDNIEKVKRDEAAARAKEEAEEQRLQELDAARRIQILRGEVPTPLLIEDVPKAEEKRSRNEDESYGRERKRRKKAGENDTDFEMRVAHELSLGKDKERQLVLRKDIDAPITDHTGHISLFPAPEAKKPFTVEKNAEVEKEAERKKREYEDQYTMRFSNAAGFKQSLDKPWYSKSGPRREDAGDEDLPPSKDVWGNEDPRRREREAQRVISNDPLAMMKQGAAQVRQVERERKKWREDRDREMRELEEAEARRKKRKRRHEDEDDEHDRREKSRSDDEKSSSRRRHRDESERERRHRHSHSRRSERRDEERRHRHKHRHRHSD